jgi:hypothetical protein
LDGLRSSIWLLKKVYEKRMNSMAVAWRYHGGSLKIFAIKREDQFEILLSLTLNLKFKKKVSPYG